MKNRIKKFRFFLRRRLSFQDFDSTLQQKLGVMCYQADKDARKMVFTRTFNNRLKGKGFEFIGRYPVFRCKELGYCYFSETNEID